METDADNVSALNAGPGAERCLFGTPLGFKPGSPPSRLSYAANNCPSSLCAGSTVMAK
jgi:hypothetical protein